MPSLSSAPTTTTLSAAERAIAKTVVADARSIPPPSGGARRVTPTEAAEAPPSKTGPEAPTPIAQPPAPAPARSPGSQTFLGAETDIAPPRKRRPALIVAIAALAVGIAVVVALRLGRGPGTAPHTTGAPPRIASATPRVTGSTSASSPRPDEDVELRIEGVPEGTIITSNGVELGAAPGPFTLRRGATAKLVFVAKGYKPKELTVSPDENLLLAIELERAPTPTLPATAVRRPPAASSTIHEDLEGFDKK